MAWMRLNRKRSRSGWTLILWPPLLPKSKPTITGKAVVKINLPDNLTRYRVMVVAVDKTGNQFGSGEANITARLPLMVRPSAPRFLNFGDRFEMPIVLQNQTSEDLETDVIIQVSNLQLQGDLGMRVSVPANDRIEVRFPISAEMAGTAKFRVAAVSGSYADAASGELPVYTPATTEAFATYGVIDQGSIVQPIARPDRCIPAVWRTGSQHFFHCPTGPDGCSDLPVFLSL